MPNEYARTYGEPGAPKTRTHLVNPGMDVSICGLDLIGDDLIHEKEPVWLGPSPRRVTCEHCQRIMRAVAEHLKIKAKIED